MSDRREQIRQEAIADLKQLAGKSVSGTYEEVMDVWVTEFRSNPAFHKAICGAVDMDEQPAKKRRKIITA